MTRVDVRPTLDELLYRLAATGLKLARDRKGAGNARESLRIIGASPDMPAPRGSRGAEQPNLDDQSYDDPPGPDSTAGGR